MKNKIIIVFGLFFMSFICLFTNFIFQKDEVKELKVYDVLAEDISIYKSGKKIEKNKNNAPEANNKVSNVLAQVSAEKEGTRSIRVLAGLDSYLYNDAKFDIVVKNGEETFKTFENKVVTRAYTHVIASGVTYSASEAFGEGYNYLVAFTINNVPEYAWGYTFEVVASVRKTVDDAYTSSNVGYKVMQDIIYADEEAKHNYGKASYVWSEDFTSITATRVCQNDETHIQTETVSANYSVVVEPTCEEEGLGRYTSDIFKNNAFSTQTFDIVIESLGHDYKVVEYVEANCEEDGYTVYECSHDSTHTYTDVHTKLGHTEVIDKAVEPTCTETGLTEGKHCSECQKILEAQEVVPALGHTYGTWEVVTEATCEEDGLEHQVCHCGYEETRVIPAHGHIYGDIIYIWNEDYTNITATRMCLNDHAHVETETVNANYSIVVYPLCEEDGLGKYTSESFSNKAFSVQSYEVVLEALGHELIYFDAKEPTCTEIGFKSYEECNRCDYTTYEEIAPLGHSKLMTVQESYDVVIYTTINDASYPFDISGSLITSTNHKNESKSSYTIIAEQDFILNLSYKVSSESNYDILKITHNSTVKVSTSGTSINYYTSLAITMKKGDKVVISYSKDSSDRAGTDCAYVNILTSAIKTEYKDVEKLVPIFGEVYENLKSCSEDIYCDVCGEIAINRIPHTEVIDEALDPTCISTGLTEGSHCSECGEVIKAQEIINKISHTVVIDEALDPTCTSTGLTEGSHCSECGEIFVIQEVIETVPHVEVITKESIDPTCTEVGFTEVIKCEVCNSTIKSSTRISAHGHEYVNNICINCNHIITPSSNLSFVKLSDGNYAVAGIGTCTDANIVIPANYNGKKVVEIKDSAFINSNIVSIYIPSSVKTIGAKAFYFSSVNYVYMEEGVESVGDNAFNSNYGTIRLMVIPSTLQNIGKEAFMCGAKCVVLNNTNLTSQAKTYDAVGYLFFNVKSVLIDPNYYCGSYNNSQFNYSKNIIFEGRNYTVYSSDSKHYYEKEIIFGKEFLVCSNCYCVADYKNYEWDISATNDDNVKATLLLENNEYMLNISGTGNAKNFSYSSLPWSDMSSLILSANIEDGVLNISNYAFYYCSNLESIEISSSVITIGEYAFSNCTSLSSVTIGNNIRTIGAGAFEYCSSLSSVTIGNNVKTIGASSFEYCTALTSIIIPENVTSIGSSAFYGCTSLLEVYNLSSLNIEKSSTSNGYVAYYALSVSNNVGESHIFTDEDGYIFYSSDDECMLVGYKGLEVDLVFPENFNGKVYTINTTFMNNSKIISITFTDGTNLYIPEDMFRGCTSLKTVYLGDSITSIGERAFYGCSNLEKVVIGDNVEYIYYEAFKNCNKLSIITFGSNIKKIDDYVFEGTTSIVEVHVDNISSWCNIPFESYYSYPVQGTGRLFIDNVLIKDLVIPNGITSIGKYAFKNLTITSVTIPNSVTSIGRYAFSECSSLTSVEIPSSVTSIGEYAFEYCKSLVDVTFTGTSHLTNISSSAFYGCSSLTNIVIPESVTTIGDYAFSRCSSLKSIVIPNSVTSIGNYAFNECSSLTIYCNTSSKPSGWGSLWNYSPKRTVYWSGQWKYDVNGNPIPII